MDDFFERSNARLSMLLLEMETFQETSLFTEDGENIAIRAWKTLRGMVSKLINIIKNAINEITNKIQYGILSKKSKEQYDQFVQACNQHPEMKGKTISVKDWRRITAEYERIENEVKKMIANDNVTVDGLVRQSEVLMNNTAEFSKSAVASITVGAALNLSRDCPEMAKRIQGELRKNGDLIRMIDSELGTGYSQNLDSKLSKMQKQTVGCKILTKIGMKKQRTMEEAMQDMGESIQQLFSNSKIDRAKAIVANHDTVAAGARALYRNKDAREGLKNINQLRTGKGGINNHEMVKQVRQFGTALMHPERPNQPPAKPRQKQ